MQALKEIQKYQKGTDLIRGVPFQKLVRETVTKPKRGVETTEFSSTSFAGGWEGILDSTSGPSEHLCYPC